MTKKTLLAAGALAFALALSAKGAHAQAIGLDEAIGEAAGSLAPGLGSGAVVAVANMDGGTIRMSDHLVTRMNAALGGRFTVVERERLEEVFREQDLQLYGRFDMERTASITRGMGAMYIVVGSLERLAGFNYFNARVICVETHAVVGVPYEASVRDSRLIRELMGIDFTPAERGGAMALNLLPGIGSFAVMGDPFGGAVQLAVGGAGWGMLIGGLAMGFNRQFYNAPLSLWETEPNAAAIGIAAGGAALILAQNIFSIARASTLSRAPAQRTVAAARLFESWDIAIAPGKRGIGQVSLSYARRF